MATATHTESREFRCEACGNTRMGVLYYVVGDKPEDAICSDCMGECGGDLETLTIELGAYSHDKTPILYIVRPD